MYEGEAWQLNRMRGQMGVEIRKRKPDAFVDPDAARIRYECGADADPKDKDGQCSNWSGGLIRLKIKNRSLDVTWVGPCCCVSCALRQLGWSPFGCTIQLLE